MKKAGVSLLEVLQLLFIVLKLIGSISWSWWWVWSPTLIPLGLVLIVVTLYLPFIIHKAVKK